MTLPAPDIRAYGTGPPCLYHVPFSEIPRSEWRRLFAQTPAATPFSSWTFHRAWWDAYGSGAEEHYLVMPRPASNQDPGGQSIDASLRAVVPLMLRDARGPCEVVGGLASDRDSTTAPERTAFFAATYHADYATILAGPGDGPAVVAGLVRYLTEQLLDKVCDSVDLRRLAGSDPITLHLLEEAERLTPGSGWRVRQEREDVCPRLVLAADWQAQLGGLDKKARHEIRRKLRRAERQGPVQLRYLPLNADSADGFIGLHQARWGSAGLFHNDEAGERSRAFLRRLAELEAEHPGEAGFHLAEVAVGDRVVYGIAGFSGRGTCYFYNAGMEPTVLDLSPGVIGTATYIRDRIARGERRFDLLRGDEGYKYVWGASDEVLHRIIVSRDPAG